MASCELCGKEKVSTKKARTAGIQVDACTRCIESMNLQVVEATVNFSKIKRPRVNTVTSRGVAGKDIMAKKDTELASDFHKRIIQARKKKGWDQRTFASKMNERLNIVQKIENGGRPTDKLILKIEKILSIELNVERGAEHTTAMNIGKRNMTIGDALDDLLSRRDK
ncbi:helix-turn-helix domain-containing protein [Euryarchaeota archaeon]|nr:helix-turn-helix domain-containing protein [Euryarchaeota archaeon]